MKTYLITENDAGQRIDKFITKAVPLLPKALLYKAIRTKRIKVNRKRVELSSKLEVGDVVELYINDEFFIDNDEEMLFLSAIKPIKVVYEDDNILLVDKAPGLIVHEDSEEKIDTLINRVQHYLYNKNEYNPKLENSFAPALCNRIDRNTGGIVIVAKNAATLRVINEKVKLREITKLYLCIVHGIIEKKQDILKAYHQKNEYDNTVKITHNPNSQTKTIITKYRVLRETRYNSNNYSLVEIDLLTGRTHQIRAHMNFINHPLVGDTKYGLNRNNKNLQKYQALYSYKIMFTFNSDSGHLDYLKGREFSVVPTMPLFHEMFSDYQFSQHVQTLSHLSHLN